MQLYQPEAVCALPALLAESACRRGGACAWFALERPPHDALSVNPASSLPDGRTHRLFRVRHIPWHQPLSYCANFAQQITWDLGTGGEGISSRGGGEGRKEVLRSPRHFSTGSSQGMDRGGNVVTRDFMQGRFTDAASMPTLNGVS